MVNNTNKRTITRKGGSLLIALPRNEVTFKEGDIVEITQSDEDTVVLRRLT